MNINSYKKIEPIISGFSEDEKYCLHANDGFKYFLRKFDINKMKRKKDEFDILKKMELIDVPVAKPIDIGIYENKGYMIQAWIDGFKLSDYIYKLTESEQYMFGWSAGDILRKIHQVAAIDMENTWSNKCNIRIKNIVERYIKLDYYLYNIDKVFNFIESNKKLLVNRPINLLHRDYSMENMMIEKGILKIIDFEGFDYGDPWEDFFRIHQSSFNPSFATAFIRGYFKNEPPSEFWYLQALYMSIGVIETILWLYENYPDKVHLRLNYYHNILEWHNNMQKSIPSWYNTDDNMTLRSSIEYHQLIKSLYRLENKYKIENSIKNELQINLGRAEEEIKILSLANYDMAKKLENSEKINKDLLINEETMMNNYNQLAMKLTNTEQIYNDIKTDLENSNKWIIQLETSTTWKITKPFRMIIDALKSK